MTQLREELAARGGARLGGRFEIEPGLVAEGEGERIVVRWAGERLATDRPGAVEASSAAPVATIVVEGTGAPDVDETVAAVRAIVESRIVGRLVGGERPAGEVEWRGRLAELPFPTLEAVFRVQLATLRGRRDSAERAEAVDWAIERVVAEVFELELSELVELHESIASFS